MSIFAHQQVARKTVYKESSFKLVFYWLYEYRYYTVQQYKQSIVYTMAVILDGPCN